MRNVFMIVKREVYSMLLTPVAYVMTGIFLLLAGWFFSSSLLLRNRADLYIFFSILPLLFLFFIPAITMRSIAEERKNGMIEQMLTFPVTDIEYIFAKFISAVLFLLFIMIFTVFYYLTVEILGEPDTGRIIASYFSAFLLGSSLISIGLFASSLCNDQITSYIVSFSIMFALHMADKVVNIIPLSVQNIVLYLSSEAHYRNMLRGVIDTRDIVYFFSLTLLFLFLTVENLERQKC